MFRNYRLIRFTFSIIIIVSAAGQSFFLRAQDLVASESMGGGGSAFVFRESRKQPQARYAGGRVYLGREGAASRGRRPHVNSQIAAASKKRRAAAAARRRAAIAAANRKIALSNELTVKAEAFLDKD